MKLGGFGLGSSGPTPEEIEKEAAAELRRAMAGSEPRPQFSSRRGMPSDWLAEQLEPDDEEGSGWRNGLTREDERRAVTDLAVQQLTERPFGNIRPEDTIPNGGGVGDAEDMRNRALSDFLERQQRMARDRPGPPASGRPRPAVVQTTSGVTISPRLTVAPTMTGALPGLPPLTGDASQPGDAGQPAPMNRSGATDRNVGDHTRPTPGARVNPAAQANPAARANPGARVNPAARANPAARVNPAEPDEADRAPGRLVVPNGPDNAAASGPAVWSRPVKPRPASSSPSRAPLGAAPPATPAADAVDSDQFPSLSPSPTVARRRPIQRRTSPRDRPPQSDAHVRWRVLAELADLLAEDVFPGDTLPAVSRWLAGTIDAMVAIMLLADDGVDDVAAWPADNPMAVVLGEMVGQPFDEHSSVWAAVTEERTITGRLDDELVLPDGTQVEGAGGWAVVPLIYRTVAFGALVVARAHDDALAEATVELVEEVAQRVARALFNCEEAVTSGNTDSAGADAGLPEAIRGRLAALALVLEAIEALPKPPLSADDDRWYHEIAQQAATLEATMQGFLTGQGGGCR
jgi:hypothetical protein